MYQAAEDRYDLMEYKRCGRSGLKLPRIALGLWQNFGLEKTIADQEEILYDTVLVADFADSEKR